MEQQQQQKSDQENKNKIQVYVIIIGKDKRKSSIEKGIRGFLADTLSRHQDLNLEKNELKSDFEKNLEKLDYIEEQYRNIWKFKWNVSEEFSKTLVNDKQEIYLNTGAFFFTKDIENFVIPKQLKKPNFYYASQQNETNASFTPNYKKYNNYNNLNPAQKLKNQIEDLKNQNQQIKQALVEKYSENYQEELQKRNNQLKQELENEKAKIQQVNEKIEKKIQPIFQQIKEQTAQ
ncbi:hypothetical protein PPERSA_09638 [Pseudocohnilembus persalinus]|uniref:Uncharacterized protein n=1 Tax=Pseudocohnilembus persalinus TaxID=266149 RepID=A0A0V0QFX6_PSEPJ|nr:hypothetical protein PPERSA_09638 [Pseudocohnilembus persalinus]|eukprot:KRX01032.1 hypothetical protein PPERSA_09638 [Pseudocohnilembus persalinus]